MSDQSSNTCRYSESEIKNSGLLSDDRFREVQAAVSSRVLPALDRDGVEIKDTLIVHRDDGTRWLHPRADDDRSVEYTRQQALPDVLTPEELETINRHCLAASIRRLEEIRFSKAQKLTEWSEGVWHGDTYHHTLSDFLESLDDEELGCPEYVWAACPQPVITQFDAWECCEPMVSERGWDGMDSNDLEGLADLQSALDKFTEANAGIISYEPDYSKAVLLAGFRTKSDS